MRTSNRYSQIIEEIFFSQFSDDLESFEFTRDEIENVASHLGIPLPKNIGDVVYSFRYRYPLPEKILKTAPKDLEWIIEGAGRAKYRFRLSTLNRIEPNPKLVTTKIPDSTPEIIGAYALSDEQALLAKVRYNRLIDVFLGITTYSLQNHLRTTVKGIGQIEIDEIYVGVDKFGRQFVVPVQAKGGSDKHGTVQTQQDFACCAEKFPDLICRAISAQFVTTEKIAMFELTIEDGDIKVVDERHYQLVSSTEISASDLESYTNRIV